MSIRLPAVLVCFAMAAHASTARPLEWIDPEELARSCEHLHDRDSADHGRICLAFAQGILSGARAGVSAGPDHGDADESIQDRAMRTRLTGSQISRASPAQRICIDDARAADEVVGHVSDYLRGHSADAPEFENASALREVLISVFPCED